MSGRSGVAVHFTSICDGKLSVPCGGGEAQKSCRTCTCFYLIIDTFANSLPGLTLSSLRPVSPGINPVEVPGAVLPRPQGMEAGPPPFPPRQVVACENG